MTSRVYTDAHAGATRIGRTDDADDSLGVSVLLVGEDNPYSADPSLALWPLPRNAAGHRLQSKILALDMLTYFSLWRTNLCPSSTWSAMAAWRRAVDLLYANEPPWSTIVCLGRKVTDAVARVTDIELPTWTWYPLFLSLPPEADRVIKIVSIPHPSGRSRAWNDPASAPRARALLAEVAPGVPWGELASRISPPA